MSYMIVFDTNYLRGMGSAEFLQGTLPSKLHDQIARAFELGYLVALPNTVRIETNAWLEKIKDAEVNAIRGHYEALTKRGYQVVPDLVMDYFPVDIGDVFKSSFNDIYLLEPTIEDYTEAERRTSYRLPPLPKSKPNGEEYRDRLIWCQLVRYSETTQVRTLIVSNDGLFENGADSTEGRESRIENVKTDSGLDQRLQQRPPHIQVVLDSFLSFSKGLKANNLDITLGAIVSVDELRKTKVPNGQTITKFMLKFEDENKQICGLTASMISMADIPITLRIFWDNKGIEIVKELSKQEVEKLNEAQLREVIVHDQSMNDLKAIIGG